MRLFTVRLLTVVKEKLMSLASRLWDWWARRKDLERTPPPGPPSDPNHRTDVFRADLRGSPRWYDPLTVRSALNAACPDWPELVGQVSRAAKPLPATIQQADPTAEPKRREAADRHMMRLADACRAAFDLPALQPDGSGYSAGECLGVLTQYLDYCRELMEKTRPLANSPAGTDSAGVS